MTTNPRYVLVAAIALLVFLGVAATAAAEPNCLHFYGNPFC